MRPLSAHETLEVWERGSKRNELERALILASAILPEFSRQQLAELSIGQRDALLLDFYELSFGSELQGQSRCPRCTSTLSFNLDLRQLANGQQAPEITVDEVAMAGLVVRFRLPTSLDFAAMARCQDVEQARLLLLERCVLSVQASDQLVPVAALPSEVVEAVATRMEADDPLAELPLSIHCAACGHGWQVLLDPAAFLWAKFNSIAERLLYEVHTLARAYGWSEPEILELSARRRQYYLQRVPKP